ncbi:MAG: Hsp20/alpha crystallin family protein [Arenicellales bacterium]|nr:Hsp20/alpha crystallin family protein [Arenicellales bacterium]
MAKAKTSKKAAKKTAKKAAKKAKTTKGKEASPVPVGESELLRPLMGLRDQIDDMFDRYFQGWPDRWPRIGQLWDVEPGFGLKGFMRTPTVDMSETDKGYEITAELPGMDEKDLEVNVTDDVLTIEGNKREEREEKKKDYYVQERRYGEFRRSLRLPQDADADKINARFDKGVLSVEIPRTGEKKRGRKISVGKT